MQDLAHWLEELGMSEYARSAATEAQADNHKQTACGGPSRPRRSRICTARAGLRKKVYRSIDDRQAD
jgi:hypothetical protein